MKNILLLGIFCMAASVATAATPDYPYPSAPQTLEDAEAPVRPNYPFPQDQQYLRDRQALDDLQRDAFLTMWESAEPNSGMAYEANFTWETVPVTTGGTGFGVAAIVAATDRGWIGRDQAVARILRIARFLRDNTARESLHGAFPHWLNGATGETIPFGERDDGADIVETSLLMQGLLIARAYFNGPGVERELRDVITKLWEDVDWNWFTKDLGNGLYWHWSPQYGFSGLKVLGYNEALITYVLAVASPTHPISRRAYDYWTSGNNYQPRDVYGYRLEATNVGGGPLFLAHYSYIGLDPRRISDAYVGSYLIRNIVQTLSNRAYCLYEAPKEYQYDRNFWGLSASQIPDGYAANRPGDDLGILAPSASLTSMPYTPFYSLEVLHALRMPPLKSRIWGPWGPYDAISLKDGWQSDRYLAIAQLPMVCMVENYRSGLLWRLFMMDKDVREGLRVAGLGDPNLAPGFPEAVVPLVPDGHGGYTPDAYDIVRHPDTGLYSVPFWSDADGTATFSLTDPDGRLAYIVNAQVFPGANTLRFPQFRKTDDRVYTLAFRLNDKTYTLSVRMH